MLGIVVIGRNEGERLKLCLDSLADVDAPLLYVDSNSSDASVALVQELGIAVLELDPAKPLSAARARREGFRQLLSDHSSLEYVFFVDGDCQIVPTWPQLALEFLDRNTNVGAVCGRRRELHPQQSVYNYLCDVEWDTPSGEAQAVGGDAIYRCSAYREAGEFDSSVAAGEEPELCKRLRDRGWKIWRLDAEMTIHDAAMTRFGQWWKRQVRTGYAGLDVERRFQLHIFDRILKSACFWGLAIPLFSAAIAVALGWLGSAWWAIAWLALAVFAYVLQTLRIAWHVTDPQAHCWYRLQYGFFTMLSKLPIALGALRQFVEAVRGKQAQLLEYKTADHLRSHRS